MEGGLKRGWIHRGRTGALTTVSLMTGAPAAAGRGAAAAVRPGQAGGPPGRLSAHLAAARRWLFSLLYLFLRVSTAAFSSGQASGQPGRLSAHVAAARRWLFSSLSLSQLQLFAFVKVAAHLNNILHTSPLPGYLQVFLCFHSKYLFGRAVGAAGPHCVECSLSSMAPAPPHTISVPSAAEHASRRDTGCSVQSHVLVHSLRLSATADPFRRSPTCELKFPSQQTLGYFPRVAFHMRLNC